MGLKKYWKLIFLIIPIFTLSSCNKNARAFSGNPYNQGCRIKGGYGTQNNYALSAYLLDIKTEIKKRVKLSENLKEILLTEIIDGGDGVHNLRIIFFNENEIIPIKIKFSFFKSKAVIQELGIGKINRRAHKKTLEIYKKMNSYGEWNISIECISLSFEQELTFYIKDRNTYKYFAQFKNFNFSDNPSIGINKDIMYIIEMLENF